MPHYPVECHRFRVNRIVQIVPSAQREKRIQKVPRETAGVGEPITLLKIVRSKTFRYIDSTETRERKKNVIYNSLDVPNRVVDALSSGFLLVIPLAFPLSRAYRNKLHDDDIITRYGHICIHRCTKRAGDGADLNSSTKRRQR